MPDGVDTKVLIPPRTRLAKTDSDDPLDYYYKPLTARVYRARLAAAGRLLGIGPFRRILEVGYGSGILLPELARRGTGLAAIDIHSAQGAVAESMRELGVDVELSTASLYEIPFEAGAFDALVCLSVLEHLTDLDGALDEFRRVLEPGGVAIVGFPVRNPVTDAFFRLAGYKPREIHPAGHADILRAVEREPGFELERELRVPRWFPRPLSGYVVCRCVAR